MKNERFLQVGIILYICSLVSPVLVTEYGSVHSFGISALLDGWFVIIYGIFAWVSNIFFLAALFSLLYKRNKIALSLSTIAFLVGLDSFAILGFTLDEGGVAHVGSLGFGFYMWMMSFVFVLIYSLLQIKKQSKL